MKNPGENLAGVDPLVEIIAHYSRYAHHYEQLVSPLIKLNKKLIHRQPETPNREAFKVAHRLTKEQVVSLLQRYEASEHSTCLSREYGIAKSTLLLLLDEHGVKKRRQPLTASQKRELRELRSTGMSIRRAAERVGTSYGTAQKYFAEIAKV